MIGGFRAIAVFALAGLLLAGCATPRIPYTAQDDSVAEPLGIAGLRFWADGPNGAYRWSGHHPRAVMAGRGLASGPTWLALSGGAEDGAYGAGVLAGWTKAGTRPQFSVVSGVSTGALIAPLAFLGPGYDDVLRTLYRETPASSLYRSHGPFGIAGSSLFDSGPLRQVVEQYMNPRTMAEIAHEYRKGRRLYIITTNLDAQRGVIWDMGAIASTGHPGALKLMQDVLMASASPPGLFAPVHIAVEARGRQFEEMHVDGAVTEQLFTPWAAARATGETRGAGRLFVLVNNRVDPEFTLVDDKVVPITLRSFYTANKKNLQSDIARAYRAARASGIDFRVTAIGADYDAIPPTPFDLEFRQKLYDYGYARGRNGAAWARAPTG